MKLSEHISPARKLNGHRRGQGLTPLASSAALVVASREIELIFNASRSTLVAVLIHDVIHPEQVKLCYALGNGGITNEFCQTPSLAKRWKVWAVLSLPEWAEARLEAHTEKPTGVRIAFLG